MTQHPRSGLQLRLPATSANLGPGFDAVGLALSLWLTIEARAAEEFSIEATGRDASVTGALADNLMLTTYCEVLRGQERQIVPLAIQLENEIPLGMGCGSSAAALCAGVLLANHFGELHWTPEQVLDEAARREGHPDNVAACLRGGFTVSKTADERTTAATLGLNLNWRLLLALPETGLATATARQLLPAEYSRADAVQNVQSTALLVSAFALDRQELLAAVDDRLHQPYRNEVCPLLPRLLSLKGTDGVHGVTLSGAGPSVLLIVSEAVTTDLIRRAADPIPCEVLELSIASGAEQELLG